MMQCVDFATGHATTILRILDLMGLNIVKNSSPGYCEVHHDRRIAALAFREPLQPQWH